MSSGRPVTLDVRVVQPETGAELPDGRVGEIRVRGRSVRGYWRSPAQTRAAFEAFSRRPRIRPPGRPPRSRWTAPSPLGAGPRPAALGSAGAAAPNIHEHGAGEQVVIVQEISTAAAGETP